MYQMIEIGKINKLKVVRVNNSKIYLDGEELGEILLLSRYASQKCKVADVLEVFIYIDSENTIIATTQKPYATVGQFAKLKVVSVNSVGAFLDWGLKKDLFVPFREQFQKMKEERSYIVFIYFDEISKRIAASSKLNKFLDKSPVAYAEGEEVELLIYNKTDMGYRAIINGLHWGVLYENEVFQTLQRGEQIKGFIKKIRDDGKIDLSLHKIGYKKVNGLSEKIMNKLISEGGFIAVTDKSPPELIYKLFGESKSTFKNAIGALYKKRLIAIDKNGIKLCDEKN